MRKKVIKLERRKGRITYGDFLLDGDYWFNKNDEALVRARLRGKLVRAFEKHKELLEAFGVE